MANYGQAQIVIGGRVKDNAEFIKQVYVASAQLDWGDARFQPHNEAEILDALYFEPAPKEWHNRLVLCADKAYWGCFEELEKWLVKNKLPFNRYSGQVGENLPEMTCFRRSWKKVRSYPIDSNNWITMRKEEILKIIKAVRKEAEELLGQFVREITVRSMLDKFDKALGVGIPHVPILILKKED